jgi:hypothetical protein
MFQTSSSDQPGIPSEVVALARQIKALSETGLHKRRIKPIVRIIFEAISHLYSDENLRQVVEKSKGKTRAISVVEDTSQNFSLDWVVDLFLVTAAVKEFLHRTEDFRDSSAYKAFLQKDSEPSSSHFALNEPENLIHTSSFNPSITSLNLSINLSISTTFREAQEDIIFESRSENSESSELSTSSEDSQDNQKIDEQKSSTQVTPDLDLNGFDTSQASLLDSRLTQQTPSRVHSSDQISRVQSEIYLFQFSHLTNLRQLFITKFSSSLSTISTESHITLTTETVLSEEYLPNASSIIFRYQSLQGFVQRNINLDFLKSILSNTGRARSQTITRRIVETISASTSQHLSISTESQENPPSLNSNKESSHQEKISVESGSSIQLTTPFKKQQQHASLVNSFLSFSILSFDFLFHEFRSSFSSDSFISSVRSVSFSRLSADLHSNLNSPRIQELDEILKSDKLSSDRSHKLNFSDSTSFTIITPVMSIFDGNASSSSVFNLTQQNIQGIVLSMFNLFAQNVQGQAQAKAVEATTDVVAVAKKSSFRVFDVRFFDPQLNPSYDSGDVIQIERDLYYRDVYLFVKRVKDAVIMSEADAVRTNLSACLRESAQV